MDQRFYHWRHKFGFKFLETIHAPEDDDKCDVFYATSVIEPKENISIRGMTLGARKRHRRRPAGQAEVSPIFLS
jgi:hypothetical protein